MNWDTASVTEQTGAAVEESSASTEELSSQVEEVVASAASLGDMAATLNKAVSRFTLDATEGDVETDSESATTPDSVESGEEQLAA